VAGDPGDLYRVSPERAVSMMSRILYYLDGFIDAAGAGRLLTTHLLSALEHTDVATFSTWDSADPTTASQGPVMTVSPRSLGEADAP